MIAVERVSMKRIRFNRLMLKRAAYAALVLFCALAVYRAINPPKQIIVERPVAGAPDLPAQAFARDFAAAWLSFDADQPNRRTAALQPFVTAETDGWGFSSPAAGSRTVAETMIEQVYPLDVDSANYVIAARTSTGLIHLSVTIARADGALQVQGFPAIVGGPARTTAVAAPRKGYTQVKDEGLTTVVERALRNWFAHQTDDLDADLAPSAEIALPDATYQLVRVEELLDGQDGSVRATVQVLGPDSERLTLTYDINVEKRADRWTISAIQTLPDWH